MDLKTKLSGEMERELHHENHAGTARLAGSPGAFVFASAFGPRIPLSPPDDGGSGGGGDPGTGGDPGAGGGGGSGGEGGDGGKQPPVRPDYIPENWWDAEKGFKADDLNALTAFKAEHDANAAQVPEKPDAYKAELPKEFKLPEGFEVPEGESLIDENDPRIAAAREFAHSRGMSQADFSELVALGVNMDISEQTQLQAAVTAQKELLGAKAVERIGAVKTWIAAKLPADQAEALAGMMYTAKQIEGFEALMRLNRGAVPGNPGAGRDTGKTQLSEEEYSKLSPVEKINYARGLNK